VAVVDRDGGTVDGTLVVDEELVVLDVELRGGTVDGTLVVDEELVVLDVELRGGTGSTTGSDGEVVPPG
jgi:hypothetical protein